MNNININYNLLIKYINNLKIENEYQEYALKILKKKNIKNIINYFNFNLNTIKNNKNEQINNLTNNINNKIIFNNGLYEKHILNENIKIDIIDIKKNIPKKLNDFFNINYINKLSTIDLLNYISIKNIVCLKIKKNTSIEDPIFIIYKNTNTKYIINNTKNFINIEKNIKIKIIEIHTSNIQKSFNNIINHIKINNNSKIKHIILNNNNNP